MEKSRKVGAQIYGYAVCLVAVITFLISISTLVNAIIDLGNPIHAEDIQPGSPSLASFEIYKMDMLKTTQQGEGTSSPSYIPDDETLRAMYEAAKNDKIQAAIHHSKQSIIIGSLLIIICVALFITHWRWMQKISRQPAE
jgi:hypothetical protein